MTKLEFLHQKFLFLVNNRFFINDNKLLVLFKKLFIENLLSLLNIIGCSSTSGKLLYVFLFEEWYENDNDFINFIDDWIRQ